MSRSSKTLNDNDEQHVGLCATSQYVPLEFVGDMGRYPL
jgi:hypothetical protein